jgi:hypothetical protein
MTAKIKISFKDYLSEVYDKPAKIHEAFSLFHEFSWNNRILAESQLIIPEPINTYKGWLALERQVKKGSKAIKLLMPVKVKSKNSGKDEEEDKTTFTRFIEKPYWFGLSQTEGKEFEVPAIPNFNLKEALKNLGIVQEEFQSLDGNCLGYAKPNLKVIAVSPLSPDPNKVFFHEMAHCLLHNDSDKIVDGKKLDNSLKEFEAETAAYLVSCSLAQFENLEYSRGYIAGWIKKENIEEKNFKRAFDAANKILKAGFVEGEGK